MENYNDEIPVDDKYEWIFENWFNMKHTPVDTKRYLIYKQDFKEDWDKLLVEHATATDDQTRNDPLFWPEPNVGNCGDRGNNNCCYRTD